MTVCQWNVRTQNDPLNVAKYLKNAEHSDRRIIPHWQSCADNTDEPAIEWILLCHIQVTGKKLANDRGTGKSPPQSPQPMRSSPLNVSSTLFNLTTDRSRCPNADSTHNNMCWCRIVIFDCGMRNFESYDGHCAVDRPVLFVRFPSHNSGLRVKRMPHPYLWLDWSQLFDTIQVRIDNGRAINFLLQRSILSGSATEAPACVLKGFKDTFNHLLKSPSILLLLTLMTQIFLLMIAFSIPFQPGSRALRCTSSELRELSLAARFGVTMTLDSSRRSIAESQNLWVMFYESLMVLGSWQSVLGEILRAQNWLTSSFFGPGN
jgi:hypothetical protein